MLASCARVGLSTIKEFEKGGGRRTIPATLAAMQQTLERAGVIFVSDDDGKPIGIHVSPPGTSAEASRSEGAIEK